MMWSSPLGLPIIDCASSRCSKNEAHSISLYHHELHFLTMLKSIIVSGINEGMHAGAAGVTLIPGVKEERATEVFIISAAARDHWKGKLLFCVFIKRWTNPRHGEMKYSKSNKISVPAEANYKISLSNVDFLAATPAQSSPPCSLWKPLKWYASGRTPNILKYEQVFYSPISPKQLFSLFSEYVESL